MSKKTTKVLASATLMSLVMTTALAAGPAKAAAGSVTRVGGADRYETAAQVAESNFADGSDNVVLVSGQGYADSISASVLAKELKAPIVLTNSNTLNSNAKDAIEKLGAKNVFIIGGNASISSSIEDGLKSSYNVTRLGGSDRYATNLAVANYLVDNLGISKDKMIAVAGTGFSDALSVAPVAAADNEILLLTNNNADSMKDTADFAKDADVTVVGTTNTVSDDIYSALNADTRVNGGNDRFETNLDVLKAFDSDLKADKLYIANATGQGYADALVASAIAGKYSAPLVLTDLTADADATKNAVNYIGTKATSETDLEAVGGEGVMPQGVIDAINNAVSNPTPDTDPEVSSIEATSLNQIKVTFNQEVDSDTAEDVANYEVDGSQLTDSDTASLQDDNKTVLITLATPQDQNDNVDVKVKKGILTADKSKTVPEYTQNVTFSDTTAPTLTSVEARGNNKLDIKFSEPVKVEANSEADALTLIAGKLKINNNNLSSYGINTETNTEDNTLKYSALDDAVKNGDYYYLDEVEVYFDSALPTGDNTLKLSDANSDLLSDAAGFPIADTTEDFTVDTLTTAPKITSITAEDSGKVYVNFDRPMDAKTATQTSYYTINGQPISNAPELKKDDTQVKISGVSGLLNKNSNTISISNKVKDAYGNKVADDTNESFTLTEDTTKPEVSSVSALDDSTIRVKFSKDVDASYAKSVSNYKLLDSDGTDITDEIDPDGITIVDGKNTDSTASVFDIKLSGDNKLSDSKYTLTIKNIQDTATTPNVMDDKTVTFDGSSDVNASVVVYNAGKDTDGKSKVALVFNKEMDSSTLGDTSNYQYINKNGDTKTLPSGADITVSSDNKSVVIKLPTSLTTDQKSTGVDNASIVTAIYATGVKDTNGNALAVGNNGGVVPTTQNSDGATVKANSVKVYYDGDDLKADINFTNAIDTNTLKASDFKLAGQQANSANASGSKVTLTFNSDQKSTANTAGTGEDASDPDTVINTIKAQGNAAPLTIGTGKKVDSSYTTATKDITGASIATTDAYTADTLVTPYFYDAAPKTIVASNASNWNATKTVDSTGNITEANVEVKFDTPIDVNSVKPSDFTFNVGNTTVDAYTAEVVKDSNNQPTNTVKFTFNSQGDSKFENAFKTGTTIKVTPKSTLGDTLKDISTVKDGNGDYAYYVPSKDDLKGITVTLASTDGNITTTAGTISGTTITVPSGTTLADFKANTKAVDGTFEVYDADGTTTATDLQDGYNVIYTPTSGSPTTTYTISE